MRKGGLICQKNLSTSSLCFFWSARFTTDPSQPANISFHDIITLSAPNAPTAIALFTDRPAAEQFRDEHAPQHQVFEMPSAKELVLVLEQSRRIATVAALDPFRVGRPTRIAPIDYHIRQHAGPRPGRDPGTPE
jgi:hypothetical protein